MGIRLSLLLLLVVYSNSLLAQVAFTGRVYSVADNNPIQNAEVRFKKSPFYSVTKHWGQYTINSSLVEEDSNTTFLGNVMYWGKAQNMALYDASGRLLYSASKEQAISLSLPRQPVGIYLLAINYENKQKTFKAYSNGAKITVVDDGANYITSNLNFSDTLIISAKGFSTRKIAVNKAVQIIDIGLLPLKVNKLDYLLKIEDLDQYEAISSTPSRSNLGQIKAIKLVYDIREDRLYYVNTPKHELHYYFCSNVIGYAQGIYHFNQNQYKQSPLRYLFLGDLNYYEAQDLFVLQFVASNEFSCGQIERFLDKIKETSYFDDKLYFLPIKEDWQACKGLSTIDTEQLYGGQNYQGYNLAETYGYLRKVLPNELETEYIGRRELVVYKGIPNDLPVVAGIITTEFQTPLSHINVLSHNRGTPNMTLKDAWTNKQLESLMGQLVFLKVKGNSYVIREATFAEADSFWQTKEPTEQQFLEYDLDYKELTNLDKANITFTDRIGAKAANFSELLKVSYNGGTVNVPEGHFAIPFYYYQKHLENHGIDKTISNFLQNENINVKPKLRKNRLLAIRDTIEACFISEDLLNKVLKRVQAHKEFNSFRFRSSTNAEDIEGFSGAGLYNSKSGNKELGPESFEKAIKHVWASLWNWRAYEEREYYKIAHNTCFMGVLVHRSFPNEEANGVVLTTNLYNANPGFIINVQYGENSIVFPEPGILHDQIMVYDWSINRRSRYTIEYLSFSNIEALNGKTVLHDKEIERLIDYCGRIKQHYFYQIKHNCNCDYQDFALDIEFKIDSDINYRNVYIKQVRIYNN